MRDVWNEQKYTSVYVFIPEIAAGLNGVEGVSAPAHTRAHQSSTNTEKRRPGMSTLGASSVQSSNTFFANTKSYCCCVGEHAGHKHQCTPAVQTGHDNSE